MRCVRAVGSWSEGTEMQLTLFGGFGLRERGSGVLPVAQRRGQALLAYLALKDGHRESREVVVDLLWPDRFSSPDIASPVADTFHHFGWR